MCEISNTRSNQSHATYIVSFKIDKNVDLETLTLRAYRDEQTPPETVCSMYCFIENGL